MRRSLLVQILCIVSGLGLYAQPKMNFRFNRNELKPGDTLMFEVKVDQYRNKFSTLHLVIEDTEHKKFWKLRYPLFDFVATAALILPDTFPKGMYAFNFSLQSPGLHIMGNAKAEPQPATINAMAKAANGEIMATAVKLDAEGNFQMPNLLFEEKATFVFTPEGKSKTDKLAVNIRTPIDSAFIALTDTTVFIPVGVNAVAVKQHDYRFNAASAGGPPETLEAVVVKGKKMDALDQYKKQYVRGVFENDGYEFDGLTEFDFSSYGTMAEIIMGRVPGLTVDINRVHNESSVMIRGWEPVFYVDEMQTDYEGVLMVPTSQIAMIKVFRPPFMGTPMGSVGGAIAIYTKRGSNGERFRQLNRFLVQGYTPQEHVLH